MPLTILQTGKLTKIIFSIFVLSSYAEINLRYYSLGGNMLPRQQMLKEFIGEDRRSKQGN
jgi:hypothetical protein